MIVNITNEDAAKAGDYVNPFNCLLATAIKRDFPEKEVVVVGTLVFIDDKEWYGESKDIRKIIKSYNESGTKIENFTPFSLELKKSRVKR